MFGRKLVVLLTAVGLSLAMSMPAFAEDATYDMEYYSKFKGDNITLNVYNWGEYISNGDDDTLDVNKEFERVTGIKVNYTQFDTNESLYAKLKSGGSSYDVVFPSDYMVSRMIDEDMLEELDMSNIPNFHYIDEKFVNPQYDTENKYSVPYTWGTVGIIYNYDKVGFDPIRWDVMWDEQFAGDILQFSNSKDAMGIALIYLGYDINTEDRKELDEAAEFLKVQKPLIQAYVMDQIFDKMQNNEAAIAPYYAGDAASMMKENSSLRFVVPEEGSVRFVDAMVIPKLKSQDENSLKKKQAAEMYINFMNEPHIAAANIEYILYSTPNTGAYELLDEDTKTNPVIYPDDETLARTNHYINLTDETNQYVDKLWTEIMSSDQEYSYWAMPLFLIGALVLSVVITMIKRDRKRRKENIDYGLFEKKEF